MSSRAPGYASILVLFLSFCSGCQTPSKSGMHVSQFTNFGVVEPGRLYRGDAPRSQTDIAFLARQYHIRTIIDLRDIDGNPTQEKAWVDRVNRDLGGDKITWINLPCDAFAPKTVFDQFRFFRQSLADLPGPIFVHCQYGRDRTGLFVAAYEVTELNRDAHLAANTMRDFGQNFIILPGLYNVVRGISKATLIGQPPATQGAQPKQLLSADR